MNVPGRALWLFFICFVFSISSCGIYTFNDVSIPDNVKTIRIGFIENKARYINPSLSAQLTDAFVKKVASQTKLTRIDDLNADYVVNAVINHYDVTTSGVSSTSQASLNRLTVGVHLTLIDNTLKDQKEYDVSSTFDFNANVSLAQAESTLMPQILKDIPDAMFNKIFSNW
ncbi:LPS assembly lipoprotein LptE [Arachidicoccus terrestris]|uniref:LPS assembly lipoprotein LptE n=1 Tax=Arachidicoccus terrestris TaxID=2875539 RepID=UPI001CC74292|nr:LptE family protein [Arachidicoccus terrestris]UAY54077.1 hypothetical protein K9M52_11425 [Arachidicoccus terrestris]